MWKIACCHIYLSANSFRSDSRLRKCNISRNVGIKMVSEHQHIQMFIDGIDSVWSEKNALALMLK